jgi:hypothetical protein
MTIEHWTIVALWVLGMQFARMVVETTLFDLSPWTRFLAVITWPIAAIVAWCSYLDGLVRGLIEELRR